MSLNLTPLGGDTFNRPDESPLDPTIWQSISPEDTMQIVNNVCVPSDLEIGCLEQFLVTAPNDQYAQCTVASLSGDADIFFRLRFTDLNNNYAFDFGPEAGGDMFFSIVVRSTEGGFVALYEALLPTIQVGDILVADIVGSTLSAYQNGNLLVSVTDPNATLASGSVAFGMDAEAWTCKAAGSGIKDMSEEPKRIFKKPSR